MKDKLKTALLVLSLTVLPYGLTTCFCIYGFGTSVAEAFLWGCVSSACAMLGYVSSKIIQTSFGIEEMAGVFIKKNIEHECKYCGAMTSQPDEDCYMAPKND